MINRNILETFVIITTLLKLFEINLMLTNKSKNHIRNKMLKIKEIN